MTPTADAFTAPLSYAQERLWSLDRLSPGTNAYNVPLVLRLRGRLDVAALHDALRGIVSRHEILRTTFPAAGDGPVQRIALRAEPALPVIDLTGLPGSEREPTARALAAEAATRPFDLAKGPLVRALLVRLATDAHLLALTTHHIVFDGRSTGVLYHELGAGYAARLRGAPDPLPKPAIQYCDYAAWQRGQSHEQEFRWWHEQLAGAPTTLRLPTDRPYPAVAARESATHAARLPAALWRRVRRLGREHQASPLMVLLAAYAVLLGDLCGADDLLVGTPIADRDRTELIPLIGLFADALPLRIRVPDALTFLGLLGRVRESCLGASAHRAVPFERLVDELRVPRTTSRSPLTQVLFAFDEEPVAPPEMPGLAVEPAEPPTATSEFDLGLAIARPAAGTDHQLTVTYRVDLFDPATAGRIAEAYLALLDRASAGPEQTIARLRRPTPAPSAAQVAGGRTALERLIARCWREVLRVDDVDVHDNFFDVGGTSMLLTMVHARLEEALDRELPLLVLYRNPTITALAGHLAGEANEPKPAAARMRADRNRLSRRRAMLSTGPRSGDPSPAPPEPGPEYSPDACVHRMLEERAAAYPGRVAVTGDGGMLTYAELNSRANRLARHLRAHGVRTETPVGLLLPRSVEFVVAALAVLKAGGAYVPIDPDSSTSRLAALIAAIGAPAVITGGPPTAGPPVPGVQVVHVDPPAGLSGENLGVRTDARNLAYVMATSGSTGEPKLVMVPHRGVVRLVSGQDYARLGPDEVILQLASVSFDAATFEIWGALLNGARLVVAPSEPRGLTEIGELLDEHGVTTLWLTAGLFHLMVDERPERLGGLRQLLAGGDVLSSMHVHRAVTALPRTTVINGYGPTEATTFTTCFRVPADWAPDQAVPIGRPIAHTYVRILDQHLQLAPVGVPGQLYVGGDGLARGYHGDPAQTAERFVPDPFATVPGARLYATGDRARYRPDGTIDFLGRLDQQVKIRGFRVEPHEVEAVLRTHPDVRDVLVVAEGETAESRRLLAYVVYADTSDTAMAELRSWARRQLPDHRVPSRWLPVERLPLTAQGKLDRRRPPVDVRRVTQP